MIKRVLTPNLHISNQIAPTDLKQLAEQGVTTIINSRPDGEVPGQITAEEMRSAARALGLTLHTLAGKA